MPHEIYVVDSQLNVATPVSTPCVLQYVFVMAIDVDKLPYVVTSKHSIN